MTADHKKTNMSALDVVNSEAAKIAGDLKMDDRVDEYIQASSFITIKDHKPNFPGKKRMPPF